MKALQLLIESQLPEELRNPDRRYTAKEVGALLSDLAVAYPDDYDRVSRLLADTGRHASYWQGETIGLSDLKPSFDKGPVMESMRRDLAALDRNDPDYERNRERIWHRYNEELERLTVDSSREQNNNIALSVLSGARGKNSQLKMMLTTPGLYADPKGRTVPLFIQNSFGQGLRPAEYLAGTFGARSTVISTKRNTAQGGDYGKQLAAVAMPQIVMVDDCGTDNGLDLDLADKSVRGRVLAQNAGSLPAGTVLGRAALKQLEKEKVTKVMARSALTCQAGTGLCKHCVGKFHDNRFPEMGQAVGVTAAQSISEPIAQSALSAKHGGGVAGTKKEYSGFKYLNQLVQSPEEFPDRATVAETQGTVSGIEEAPQGGYFVQVGDQRHYVRHGYPLTVKVGDQVEAGDQLSEGLVDASDIVRLRGLGSGRRYLADRLHTMLEDSGVGNDRRNVEIVARAAIDHIRVQDDSRIPGTLPDDQLSYNRTLPEYVPPASTRRLPVDGAVGKYLQAPALHYSIGQKLTPKQVRRLRETGYDQVLVSDDEPGFTPEMQRLRTATQTNPDWLARMHGSYLQSNLERAAVRGQDTNYKSNPNFVPRLAYGKDFGKDVRTTGEF